MSDHSLMIYQIRKPRIKEYSNFIINKCRVYKHNIERDDFKGDPEKNKFISKQKRNFGWIKDLNQYQIIGENTIKKIQ